MIRRPSPLRRLAWVLAAAGTLFVVSPSPARAQCPLADGLDGGACWTVATPTLPVFPVLTTDARGLCWLDCVLEADRTETLELGRPRAASDPARAPVPLKSVYVSRYTLKNGSGDTTWSGVMRMIYSRTWYESSATANYQVWRFLVNGDLRATAAAGAAPCPVPPCAASFSGKVHFTGYVDYARDCATGTFSTAGAIGHGLDFVDHFGSGNRGGTFHADRDYDFVWPAAGFTPETNEFFSNTGNVVSGALRPVDWTVLPASSAIELYETTNAGGSTTHFGDRICPSDAFGEAATYKIGITAVSPDCGIQVVSSFGANTLFCRAVGSWSDATRFPGTQSILLVRGFLRMTDPCRPRDREEFFRGVYARGGFAARGITQAGIGGLLPADRLDLGNELGLPPAMAPSRNVKCISDLIVNVNLIF